MPLDFGSSLSTIVKTLAFGFSIFRSSTDPFIVRIRIGYQLLGFETELCVEQ